MIQGILLKRFKFDYSLRLYRRKINSEAELYRIIENYINFYNSERLHSANHYKSPDECEEEYYKK